MTYSKSENSLDFNNNLIENSISHFNNKKVLGQFYTDKNIFNNIAFLDWFNKIPMEYKSNILEPFAGSNGIIKMLNELSLIKNYTSYDIVPMNKNVVYKDTIKDFPLDFKVVISNPPFLAKNSATRRGLNVKIHPYHDLYELCVDLCLKNTEYVAVIIPESFITNNKIDKSRLSTVISLQEKNIFKDTEHPVCLALFTPFKNNDFKIYHNNEFIGLFNHLKNNENKMLSLNKNRESKYEIIWHNPKGQVGLKTIDVTNAKEKIKFMDGDSIPSEEVSLYSRLRTRILIINKKTGKPISKTLSKKLIILLNQFLDEYRIKTNDVFLTSFKGLRDDSKYRRRLDFSKAKLIVQKVVNDYLD